MMSCAIFLSAPLYGVGASVNFGGVVRTIGSGSSSPIGVALDGNGNVFVADQGTYSVYEIMAAGGYTTVHTLTRALTIPTGVAVDGSGNVFVTDQNTSKVYEMLASNGYSTLVTLGSGFYNPNGIAVDASGDVFVADTQHNAVKEIVAVNGTIPAVNPTILTLGSGFSGPTGVALDASGNVFVIDQLNGQLKEILATGGYTTVNVLASLLQYPVGVTLDAAGNAYFTDSGHNVLKVLLAAGGYTSVRNLGYGFSYPAGAALDAAGNVFVSDYLHHAVKEITLGAVPFPDTLVATGTPATVTLTFDFTGNITGLGTPVVLTKGAPGLDFTDAGTGTCTTNGNAHSYSPGDTCTLDVTFTPTQVGPRRGAAEMVDGVGNVLATAFLYGTGTGPEVTFLPGTQTTISGLHPTALAVDAASNLFVANTTTNTLQKETYAAGSYTLSTVATGFNNPEGVALDGAGNLFVTDAGNHRVIMEKYAGGSYSQSVLVPSITSPAGIAADTSGNVYVSDASQGNVRKLTLAFGAYTSSTLSIGGLASPSALAVDNAGNLYIADTGHNRVVKETPAPTGGYVETVVVNIGLSSPYAVAVDGSQNVYISDSFHSRVVEAIPTGGAYTQVVLPITGLGFVDGLAIGDDANVYAGDLSHDDIVKLDVRTAPTLVFPSTDVGFPSAADTVTLSNVGTIDLNFPIPGSGNNPLATGPFSFSSAGSTACPLIGSTSFSVGVVAAGTSCTIPISFTPVAVGSASGTVAITDSNLNAAGPSYATQTIQVSGVGITPVAAQVGLVGVPDAVLVNGNLPIVYGHIETASGNTVANSTATITLTFTGPGGFTHTLSAAAVNGVAAFDLTSFPLTAMNATYTLVASSSTLTSAYASPVTVTPLVATTAVASTFLLQNHVATAFTPASSTGGGELLPLTISPALPAGLSFSSSTGVVSGTPTAVTPTTLYTVTFTDAIAETATATFSLTVYPPVTATAAIPSVGLTLNAAAAYSPVTATGGHGTLSYTVSPALPSGVSFSTSGSLGGTPLITSPATNYTVTVTDTVGNNATAVFSLLVNSPVAAATVVPSTLLTQGRASTTFTPVSATGGSGTLTYGVAPALPAGLTFSAIGSILGTPTAASALATYTVTVTDINGGTASSTFSLTVNAAVAATAVVPSTSLTLNRSAAVTPVTATGGTGALTFGVSSALPTGLSFSSTTGAVSGTPTAASAATTYTVTATDVNGATATATFSLAVTASISAVTAVPQATLFQNRLATAFTPVTATGGTGTLTFTIAPALPAGLAFSSTGTVSGTPSGTSSAATYTVTATDLNGVTGTAAFSLTVGALLRTATAISSSALAPALGSPVTLTATVTPASTDTPPGTVRFYSGTTLLGTSAPSSGGVATFSIILPQGQDSVTAVYSGSARYDGSTSAGLLVAAQAGTTVTLTATPTTQLFGNPIVLTAHAISPTAGTLTGTVTFLDGSVALTTIPLGSGGVATYSTTGLADGPHTLTATYSGDANFLPGVSSTTATSITVSDLNLNLGSDQNHTVVPGAAVDYSFPLSPLVTPTFVYDVHLTATGLPPGATYTFSPAMIPAGSGSLPVTLTVQTAKNTADLRPARPSSRGGLTTVAFVLFLPLLGLGSVRKRLRTMPRPLAVALFVTLGLGAMTGLSGCGAGGFFGATSTSGHYTITVTATSADLIRTSTVQLTIQ